MRNNKAQIATTMTWAVAGVIILFLMIIFFVVTTALSGKKLFNKNEISFEEIENLDSQRELVKILNSPVEIEGTKDVKELIKLRTESEKDYQEILDKELEKILNEFEYEYVDSKMNNLRRRGFALKIYRDNELLSDEISSEIFKKKDNPCIMDTNGCKYMAKIFIFDSDFKKINIILFESEGAK